jgi:hypothetical protein
VRHVPTDTQLMIRYLHQTVPEILMPRAAILTPQFRVRLTSRPPCRTLSIKNAGVLDSLLPFLGRRRVRPVVAIHRF